MLSLVLLISITSILTLLLFYLLSLGFSMLSVAIPCHPGWSKVNPKKNPDNITQTPFVDVTLPHVHDGCIDLL
jgi:hypothetical protein